MDVARGRRAFCVLMILKFNPAVYNKTPRMIVDMLKTNQGGLS